VTLVASYILSFECFFLSVVCVVGLCMYYVLSVLFVVQM
jgi:hypothetical protein